MKLKWYNNNIVSFDFDENMPTIVSSQTARSLMSTSSQMSSSQVSNDPRLYSQSSNDSVAVVKEEERVGWLMLRDFFQNEDSFHSSRIENIIVTMHTTLSKPF
jgi:hypothetical protein